MKSFLAPILLLSVSTPFSFSQDADDKSNITEQLAEVKKQRNANITQRNAIFSELKQKPASLQAREESDAAWKAYEQLRASHPKVVEARNALDDAKAALESAIDKQIEQDADAAKLLVTTRESPDRVKDLEFQIAVADFKLSHPLSPWQRELDQDPEIQRLRDAASTAKDRRAAVLAYRKARQEKLSALKSAQPLIAERDALKSEMDAARERFAVATNALSKLRDSIKAKPTSEIEAALDKHANALNGVDAAYKSEDLVTTYESYRKLFRAYSDGLNKQTESDPRVIELDKQRKELDTRIAELEAKLKAATK